MPGATQVNAKWVFSLLAALLICGCKKARELSSSMAPTITAGEKVTIDYTAYAIAAPKRWDVVAFEPPMWTNQIFAMRIVALPGETVAFATGGVTVNGLPLVPPPYLTNVNYVSLDHSALIGAGRRAPSPYVVPSRSYFVLGDNSTNSNDSRMWGAVPLSNIVGRVRHK